MTKRVPDQEVIELPERETMTILGSSVLPDMGQTVPVSQNSGVTNTVGDTTTTTSSLANNTVQSAPAQTGATAQNVLSPGALSTATQTQYAPVTASGTK